MLRHICMASRLPARYVLRQRHRQMSPGMLWLILYHSQYKRTLNAVKLEKMFAKPFLWAMDQHTDGLTASAVSPTSNVVYLSGAADGEVRVWDLAHRSCVWRAAAHDGFVRSLTVAPSGAAFFSCGDDGCVKQWALGSQAGAAAAGAAAAATSSSATSTHPHPPGGAGGEPEPIGVWSSEGALRSVHAHPSQPMFVTAGRTGVALWSVERSAPSATFSWSAEAMSCARFNPADPHMVAACGGERRVTLIDTRQATPVRAVELTTNGNSIAWNPREPMNFLLASEDHNAYTFDMRHMAAAALVHKDHVSAVLDVAWAPTGRSFATASYDKTVRLWDAASGTSRAAYHTKRMQRVFTVEYTSDAQYVVSGSDDANVRVWKADASAPLGKLAPRARAKLNYQASLKKRYAHMPEVKRIAKQQYVPKPIAKAQKRRREASTKAAKALANINRHSKVPRKAEPARTEAIMSEQK